MVERALAESAPYAMAFVDVRMPPGWDGIETALAMWKAQPDLQIVICTAYSDYSWQDMLDRLGATDRLVILRKPFDAIEVLQLANALTEKWALLRETRRYAAELEERVRARTADLEAANAALQAEIQRRSAVEADLVRAKEAAETADRTKSAFLANMSHEIRTPMNGVIGMANLLLTSRLNDEQRDYAQTISSCCDSLLTIINDILDLSKIEAGRMELETIEFDVKEIVALAVDLQRDAAKKKSLRFDVEYDPNLPAAIVGDPGRLRQVLINLIANAVKFTERGAVVVRVQQSHRTDDGRVALRFEVQDSGVGIAPEVQDHLFQPFVQADSTMTRRFGGTGLGLAISKRIVSLMGGEIGVNSTFGHGATFWFTGNFGIVHATPPPLPPVEPPPARAAYPADIAPILVAEDNLVNQKVLALMLRNLGYPFRIVGNGREAIEALSQEAYSLVLMDEHMPELDGVEATRRIRAADASGTLRRNEAIPIIAITADAMVGTRERCLAAGMNDYLAKPLHPESLAAMVADHLAAVGGV